MDVIKELLPCVSSCYALSALTLPPPFNKGVIHNNSSQFRDVP